MQKHGIIQYVGIQNKKASVKNKFYADQQYARLCDSAIFLGRCGNQLFIYALGPKTYDIIGYWQERQFSCNNKNAAWCER